MTSNTIEKKQEIKKIAHGLSLDRNNELNWQIWAQKDILQQNMQHPQAFV